MSSFSELKYVLKRGLTGKKVISVALVLMCLESMTSLSFPLITQNLVDGMGEDAFPIHWLLFLALVLICGSLFQGVTAFLMGRLGQGFMFTIRQQLVGHLLTLPVYEFEKGQSAEPASRVVNDSKVIATLISQHLQMLVSGLITLLGSLVILFLIDPVLTGVLFGCVLVAFLMMLPFITKISGISKQIQEKEANLIGSLSEIFSQIRLVKSTLSERHFLTNSTQQMDSLRQSGLGEVKVVSFIGPIVGIAISVAMVTILTVGAARVESGNISLGALVAFILYLFNVVLPLAQLSNFFAGLNKSAGAAIKIKAFFDTQPQRLSGQGEFNMQHPLEVRALKFAYPNAENLAVDVASLTIPYQKTTALVGSSGSGKSSLFALLNRFYESEGIYLNQTPIGDLGLTQWRSHIAYVDQDCAVMSGTIRENLSFGAADCADETLINCLKEAQLWSLLEGLEGLDTRLGERGINLSGGQRQRLAIARAVLRDPSLLLLDEATSALDAQTENLVTQYLQHVMKNRTTIIAAHRLNTVLTADQIVVMDQGSVSDVGSHSELMARSEVYQNLVAHQLVS